MIEKFLAKEEKSLLWTEYMINKINKHLEDPIEMIPFKELDSPLVNSIYDDYSDASIFDEDKIKMGIYQIDVNQKLKSLTINLENYNKLSENVGVKVKDYVFEVVDYFKRNYITNIKGKITFLYTKNSIFVYNLYVDEIES